MSYRSQKLLDAARDQACVICGSVGTTVAAHSNLVEHGKGVGVKAPDYRIAFLCMNCHSLVDGRVGKLTRDEKRAMWIDAHVKTVGILFEKGFVKLI